MVAVSFASKSDLVHVPPALAAGISTALLTTISLVALRALGLEFFECSPVVIIPVLSMSTALFAHALENGVFPPLEENV